MLGQPNATITIPIQSATPTGFDPYTGEPIFTPNQTESIDVVLEEKTPPRENNLPGVDNAIAYLEGRIESNPPPQLLANTFYPITINLQNEIKQGNFYLVATPTSRLGLEAVFGLAIHGWLVT